MREPRDLYPHAIIPEHLTKLTIEKLPLDRVFYIEPGERDDFEPPAIFAGPDRFLRMSKSYAVDRADEYPQSPIGLVGVMKTFVINPSTNEIQEQYVADLRFIGDHQLMDSDDMAIEAMGQEEYMGWVAELENSVVFSAFIAAEEDADINENAKVEGVFYGNPLFYEALERTMKRGDKRMKKFLKRSEQVPAAGPETDAVAGKPEDKNGLSVIFSHKTD